LKKICEISSYLFDDYVIISFTKDWINAFGCIPTFDVIIDDKKNLVLKSKTPIRAKGEN